MVVWHKVERDVGGEHLEIDCGHRGALRGCKRETRKKKGKGTISSDVAKESVVQLWTAVSRGETDQPMVKEEE